MDNKTQYMIDCLKSAVAYCKQQFNDSGIDWLPSICFIDNELDEAEKFTLVENFIKDIERSAHNEKI